MEWNGCVIFPIAIHLLIKGMVDQNLVAHMPQEQRSHNLKGW